MTKEQLIHIFKLIDERNRTPLFHEGCKRIDRSPYSGFIRIHSQFLFNTVPGIVLHETIEKTYDSYGEPVPQKDWDAIAASLDSLKATLILAIINNRSDDYLAASGEPEYWEYDLCTVTYYPDGSCSEVKWA